MLIMSVIYNRIYITQINYYFVGFFRLVSHLRGAVAGGARGGHGPPYRQDPSENWKFDILSEFLRSSFSLYYAILIYEWEIYFSTM